MDEAEFYEGFEDHLRKLYAGGWAPESIPGRNAQEEFTKWLNHLKARVWEEGFDVAERYTLGIDLDPGNPYVGKPE